MSHSQSNRESGKHYHHAMDGKVVATGLTRVRAYVTQHPSEVMTSLYHHVTDIDNLRSCFEDLDGSKALGIDGVDKEEYRL